MHLYAEGIRANLERYTEEVLKLHSHSKKTNNRVYTTFAFYEGGVETPLCFCFQSQKSIKKNIKGDSL